jgi:basic membrane lipoprotein Med (substrate-binding protein (PBP1-ABC) superfamily)
LVAHAAPLKVAFVYVSPVGDVGWSFSHDLGRKYLEEHSNGEVVTQFVESVPEGRKARETFVKLAQENDVIFATSWGYMVSMERVAEQYPNVKFEHATGIRRGDNLSTYATRIYEARYLSGIVAASMSKTNRVGYVAAFPIPEVIRGLNAFTLGAQSVNPNVTVAVEWTHAWYNPTKAKKLSNKLINEGADVLAQHTDSPAPVEVAQRRGVYAIGYHSDMGAYGADSHLTSVVHDWGKLYQQRIKSFMNNSAEVEDSWTGLKDGSSKLSSISSKVPRHVVEAVKLAKQQISDGELSIFSGPIKNHKGRTRIKEGKALADDDLKRMSWYVAGIEGNLKFY